MNLTNNTILITGGTRGIGLSMVKRFYDLDNSIIVAAKNKNGLDELKKNYPKIDIIQVDLANSESLDNFIKKISSDYQSLNVLINNAGIQVNNYDKLFGEDSEDSQQIKDEIQINLTSPLQLIHGLIPILMTNSNPAIVNVSSALGFVPKKSAPVYCATKSAIHIFTKALRYQYENTKLSVFEVIPSLVETDMTKGRGASKITPDDLVDEFLRGFKQNKLEINIGKVKLLRTIQRISPRIAEQIIKNS